MVVENIASVLSTVNLFILSSIPSFLVVTFVVSKFAILIGYFQFFTHLD